MIRKALNLLAGEVRIQVRGASVERFLNQCARGGIGLKKTHRVDFGELHTTVSVRDFKRLRGLMGRTGCRVHILRRRGAPFTLHRLKRRYVLLAGGFAMAALFFALSNFVWVVEVQAEPGISTYMLREALREAGAYAGVPIAAVDETQIREYVRAKMQDSIDFLTVSRIGNVISVKAFGGQERPQVQDDQAVTGIVAARDGRILQMEVLGGNPLVEPGDVVQRGQQLVSAYTPPTTEQGLGHIGHGDARIIAETRRVETSVRPLESTQKQYTGKIKTQFALILGNTRINLYFGSGISAGECDKRVSVHRLSFGQGTVFPVALVRQEYTYYEAASQTDDAQQLREQLEQNTLARMQTDMIQGQVDAWHSERQIRQGGLFVTVHASCTEEIGLEISEEGLSLPPPAEETDEDKAAALACVYRQGMIE